MIGKITTAFDTDNPQAFGKTGGIPDRTRSLFGRFVREHLLEHLMKDQDAQQAFGEWIEDQLDRDGASKKTKRNDLKDIRRFADRNQMQWLSAKMEGLLLEARNNVPNKGRNFDLTRLISQDTIKRLQDYFETQRFTQTQYEAIQLFLATCMTGLRTIEWATARLVTPPCKVLPGESQELPYLEVRTAKTKSSEERLRYLILDEFTETQVDTLYQTLQYAQSISKGTRSNLVIQARRVLQNIYMGDPGAVSMLADIDFRTARKMFTVELRRGGASMKEAAAALGHVSINNVRYYSHGDLGIDRTTKLPLARPPRGEIAKVKDTLAELNESRLKKGQPGIKGYLNPETGQPRTGPAGPNDPANRTGSNSPSDTDSDAPDRAGRNFLDNL